MDNNKFKVVKLDDLDGMFTNDVFELYSITKYGDHKLASIHTDKGVIPTANDWQAQLLAKANQFNFLASEIVK